MADESELLNALFAAALGGAGDEDLWPAFLERLAGTTRAESALLHFLPRGSATSLWQVGASWDGPDQTTIERMRTGRVYSQVDLPRPAGAEARPLRALKWTVAEGVVLVAMQREGADFRAMDGVVLSNLTPYLEPALSGWRRLDQQRLRARLDQQTCAKLGAGWIVFSPTGDIVEMAPSLAERLEAIAGIARRADGRLSLPSPGAAQALRHAISAAPQDGPAKHVELSRAPHVQMVLTQEHLLGEPALVGRIRYELSARSLSLDRVAACFGLSRSEARLAVRLCDGFSLKDAAQDLGWTLETARSCSKQIFARMSVSGQPGVVRRMLESAVWLG